MNSQNNGTQIHIITLIGKIVRHNILLLVDMNQLTIRYAYHKLYVLINDVSKKMKADISYNVNYNLLY